MDTIACTLRLHLSELPELPSEPETGHGLVKVGLQTKKNEILPGHRHGDGWIYETEVEVRLDDDPVDFRGPTVHGGPGARFLYLSWKRPRETPPLWVQRVKIPLAGAAELLSKGRVSAPPILEVDITGRAPHEVTPLDWTSAG